MEDSIWSSGLEVSAAMAVFIGNVVSVQLFFVGFEMLAFFRNKLELFEKNKNKTSD